jgi:hypothetical protein
LQTAGVQEIQCSHPANRRAVKSGHPIRLPGDLFGNQVGTGMDDPKNPRNKFANFPGVSSWPAPEKPGTTPRQSQPATETLSREQIQQIKAELRKLERQQADLIDRSGSPFLNQGEREEYSRLSAEITPLRILLNRSGVPPARKLRSQNNGESPTEVIHKKGQTPEPSLNYHSELKRAIALQLTKHHAATALEVCRYVDADGSAELPENLSKNGQRSFEQAYRDRDRRHKLEIIISKVRNDMRKKRLLPPR